MPISRSLSFLAAATTTTAAAVVASSSSSSSSSSSQIPYSMTKSSSSLEMEWQPRSSYDTTPNESLGRHHPITFANETHGFVLGGSTATRGAIDDLYIYEEATDTWTDASDAISRSSFPARTFGYGVVLDERNHPKAYLGFGSGVGADEERLGDWWEFDMTTLEFRELARFPGEGRHHPSMVAVYLENTNDANGGGGGGGGRWVIHVGLGDGLVGDEKAFIDFDDYWAYDIDSNAWTQLPNFPSTARHHPFYFGINGVSYVGLGHSSSFPYIERDFYSFSSSGGWSKESDFESYTMDDDNIVSEPIVVTTEARVAGTQFSIVLPLRSSDDDTTITATGELVGSIGFVLSGDGDDHDFMAEGEFHAFYPAESHSLPSNSTGPRWRSLKPHPGVSRWAPGSFVMRDSARAYFTSGYDRTTKLYRSDVWGIDLSPLFRVNNSMTITDVASNNEQVEIIPDDAATSAMPVDAADETSGTCTTRAQCNQKRLEMGVSKFVWGIYSTKGCFSKMNDKGEYVAFWSSGGTTEEMSKSDLPGVQERIVCEGTARSTSEQAIAIVYSQGHLLLGSNVMTAVILLSWLLLQ